MGDVFYGYGAQSENNSQNSETGAEPTESWTNLGPFIPENTQVQRLRIGLRVNNTEITGFDARVYFQTGPRNAGWSNTGTKNRTLIGSLDAVPLPLGMNRSDLNLGGFVAPSDGYLLVFLRPVGALTATRYIYSSMMATCLTPT